VHHIDAWHPLKNCGLAMSSLPQGTGYNSFQQRLRLPH
jgi:hypothetical protein